MVRFFASDAKEIVLQEDITKRWLMSNLQFQIDTIPPPSLPLPRTLNLFRLRTRFEENTFNKRTRSMQDL
jgi:hypothetical protein